MQMPEVLTGEFLAFIPVLVYVILTSLLMRGYLWLILIIFFFKFFFFFFFWNFFFCFFKEFTCFRIQCWLYFSIRFVQSCKRNMKQNKILLKKGNLNLAKLRTGRTAISFLVGGGYAIWISALLLIRDKVEFFFIK